MDELEPLKRRISSHMPSVVGLLAHVKTDDQNRSFAEAMGTKKQGSDQPIVSDLRFRRILRVEDQDELYTTMIRVIRMLDGNVNVTDLATSVFFWNEQTRKRWASLYYLKRNIY
jgi:CRISPR system Cascade subunit CasB